MASQLLPVTTSLLFNQQPGCFRASEYDVRTRLIFFTQARATPVLEEDEIEMLMQRSKRWDQNRNAPSDPAWIPTWNVNKNIAMGWELKAMKVITAVDIESGKQKIARSQMYKHFLEMSNLWKRRSCETIELPSTVGSRLRGINSGNDELWDLYWQGYSGNDGVASYRHGWAIPGVTQWIDDF